MIFFFFGMLLNAFFKKGDSSHSSMISDISTKITMKAQSERPSAHHCVEHKLSVSSQKSK